MNKYKENMYMDNCRNLVSQINLDIKLYMQTEEYKSLMARYLLLEEPCLFTLPSENFFDEIYNIEFISNACSTSNIIFIYCDASLLEKIPYINYYEKVVFIVTSNNKNINQFNLYHYYYVFWTIPLKDYWLFCADYRQIQNFNRLLDGDYEIYSHNYNLHFKFDIDQNLLKGSYITFISESSLRGMQMNINDLELICNHGNINVSCTLFEYKRILKETSEYYYNNYSSFSNIKFMSLGKEYYKMLIDYLGKKNFKDYIAYYNKDVVCLNELRKYKYLHSLHLKKV